MPGPQADAKLSQYLNEARATEQALIQTLQAHIAMTPGGSYREALEGHLEETREHSRLLAERLAELSPDRGLLSLGVWAAELGVGVAQSLTGRLIATWKAPIDMLRGSGGEEKLLKNAKDECASEALEIATYEALESLAGEVGDAETAELARRIRRDEERMLARLREEIKALATQVVQAEVAGRPTYQVDRTGAADGVRTTTRRAAQGTRRSARSSGGRAETAGGAGTRTAPAAGRSEPAAETRRTRRPSRVEGPRRPPRRGQADARASAAPPAAAEMGAGQSAAPHDEGQREDRASGEPGAGGESGKTAAE